jgi:hypothetical protein
MSLSDVAGENRAIFHFFLLGGLKSAIMGRFSIFKAIFHSTLRAEHVPSVRIWNFGKIWIWQKSVFKNRGNWVKISTFSLKNQAKLNTISIHAQPPPRIQDWLGFGQKTRFWIKDHTFVLCARVKNRVRFANSNL